MGQIEGALAIYQNAGAPVNGTNEEQTITPSAAPASGTWYLKFEGYTTAVLAWNISAANLQTALNALPSIGAGGVAVALNGGVYTVVFSGANVAKRAQALITVVNSALLDAGLAAVTMVVAESVAGVEATCLGALPAALLLDTTNKILYVNAGTQAAPTWQAFIPSGITASAAEINLIDGSVAGTAVASKALVLGANKNVDVLAVADLKLGAGAGTSVDRTAAQINLLLQGLAAGYKIARGVEAVTGTATVVTGLATVVAVLATAQDDLDGDTLAGVSATIGDQNGAPAAGSVYLKAWKNNADGDATMVAANAAKSVNWIAIGT